MRGTVAQNPAASRRELGARVDEIRGRRSGVRSGPDASRARDDEREERALSPPTPATLRARLEADATRFDVARLRYRALVQALRAWRWQARLRATADIARAAAVDAEVTAAALARARRRAQAESWERGEVLTLLEELSSLEEELVERVEARLGELEEPDDASGRGGAGRVLERGLRLLVERLVRVPRRVPITQRDAVAAEALSDDDPDVQQVGAFAWALSRAFARPLDPQRPLGIPLDAWDAVRARWDERSAALESCWRRVNAIDTTGGVGRMLERKAARAPKKAPESGPTRLVAATFWQRAALAQLTLVVDARVAPVLVQPNERLELFGFLLARERDGAARLDLPGARAALLMLAAELKPLPDDRAPLEGGAAQARRWAREADAARGDDWRRLRDALSLLHATKGARVLPALASRAVAPPPRHQTLEALLWGEE